MPFGMPSFYFPQPFFRELPRSCPPPGTVPPQTPRAYGTNRLTPAAAADIPVRFAHSNVVGTYGSPTNAPSLKCGFFWGWSGIGLCAAFFHRGLSPLCGGGFLRCRSKNLLLSPLEVLGRCLSACRVFYFPQPFFPGVAKELPAARRFFKKRGVDCTFTVRFIMAA